MAGNGTVDAVIEESYNSMEDHIDQVQCQCEVLKWADGADSFDKLSFLKAFVKTLGKEEIHHAKNIMAKALRKPMNQLRSWVGPNPTDSFKNHRKRVLESEDPSFVPEKEAAPLSRPVKVSRRGDALPEAWWKAYNKSNVVGYDAEHVHLIHGQSVDRIRVGKLAIVNSKYETDAACIDFVIANVSQMN